MTDNYVWAPDRRNEALHLMRRELIRLSDRLRGQAEAMKEVDEEGAKKRRKTAYLLQQRHALTKVEPELKAHPRITQTMDDFDAEDYLLNTPDGIVDLRTGQMRPPDPEKLMSKATAVAPKQGTPERWMAFLQEATGGDEELMHYLQRLVGYALTGSTQEQILAFIHGPTRTGKSTFLETLGGVFGTYHELAAAESFSSSRSRGVPADIAALAGARLVTASETREGEAWDTQRVKMLTGGDHISARFLYQDFFSYQPKYQIIIVGNSEPEVDGVDEALMRRLHIIPFNNRPENVDRLLKEKLKPEWPRILQWAIDGCLMWLEEGLDPPQVIRERTEQYRREEDPVGMFVQECCVLEPEAELTRHDLYCAWRDWCHEQGEDPGTKKRLRRMFRDKEKEHGLTDVRIEDDDKYRRGYRGIRLTEDRQGGFTV